MDGGENNGNQGIILKQERNPDGGETQSRTAYRVRFSTEMRIQSECTDGHVLPVWTAQAARSLACRNRQESEPMNHRSIRIHFVCRQRESIIKKKTFH